MKISHVYVVRTPTYPDAEIIDYAFKTSLSDKRNGTNHLVYYILGSHQGQEQTWFNEETSVFTTKEAAVDDACERYRKKQNLKRCPSGIRAAIEEYLSR